jgi:hypothetical protein
MTQVLLCLLAITVEAGKVDRIDTPVGVALEGIDAAQALRLEEVTPAGRKVVPAQVEPGTPPRLWFILAGKTPAGTTRTFELVQGPPAEGPKVEVKAGEGVLDVLQGGRTVLQYHRALSQPPAGYGPEFRRSGFIAPVRTPAGRIVTDTHPPNHKHHMGVWMPWTKTEFEGRKPDFWNLGAKTGTVRFVRLGPVVSGPVFASIEAHHEHVDLSAPGGEKVALKEVWTVRVWNVGGPDKGYFLWDLTSTQRGASDSPLKLPKYRYGGMGFRAARAWDDNVCLFLTSEGKTRKDGNETTARWCDVYGPVDGTHAGAVLMGHPENFRFPEPVRIHPTEPFFGFAPSQGGDWAIEPGKDYVFRYRFCVHDGLMKAETAERFWADFGQPPVVRVANTARGR